MDISVISNIIIAICQLVRVIHGERNLDLVYGKKRRRRDLTLKTLRQIHTHKHAIFDSIHRKHSSRK